MGSMVEVASISSVKARNHRDRFARLFGISVRLGVAKGREKTSGPISY